MPTTFRPGDVVVYKKQKNSTRPGPRAHDLAAAVQDGKFSYVVDKYWVVTEVNADGSIVVQTRRGKRHTISRSDPNLRSVNWWQRLRNRAQFLELKRSVK